MYVCMYVCMYTHLGFKMMWSPFTLRCGGRTGPGALKAERIFSFLLWGWIVRGGEGPPEFFGGFSFRPWGMPWPPWNLLPFMARIRSLAIGTGNFILLILSLTVCVRVWNNDSISPPGYTNATGFNGPFAAAATCAGTGLQPSSSYMRVGWCCMLQTNFWSSGKLTGLMKNLVRPCLMFCASGVILNWMRWTKACGARRLWLYISRPLLGAYKLQRQSGPKGFHPLEMTQALWACYLPGMLYLTVLSQCIRVLGCNVSQATRRCLPLQHAILCPLLTFSNKYKAVCTVWLTAKHCLFRRTSGLLGHLGPLKASVPKQDLRAGMVDRGPGGGESSSGEYVDVRLDSEEEGDGDNREPRPGPAGNEGPAALAAAKAAPATGARVVYDRLGQVVREPTGPPPIVLAADAEEDEDSESSEHDVDEAAEDLDDPEAAPLPHEMEPEFRHVSLAMSNAICEVLRRNGNSRAEFHVLSIPPAAWKTTEGFVLQALPLSGSARRHPNILRCADGPTFEPPSFGVERSEMTDAELADDEEMAALRAEMDAEPAANMRPSRSTSRRSTATTAPSPPAGHPRMRRQPWPSKYAPPVPTPATTSDAGACDESSRPSEDMLIPDLTPAARMTNEEVEAAIADLELRTLIDELETEEMEAEASAVHTTPGPTVEQAPGGEASSSSGGTLAPVTPATASTMTSGRPVDTPLRSNRKQGAYLHYGLRTTVVCIVSFSHVRLHGWCLHSGAENLTGPSRVVPLILRPRHPQQLLLTWCCRPWFGHWTDCPFATPPEPEGKRKQLSCPTSSCTLTCSISAIPWLARYSPRRTMSITSVALLCSWALCMWNCAIVLLVRLYARRYRSTPPTHTGDTIARASTTAPPAGLAENSDAIHTRAPGHDHTPTQWRPVRALQAGPTTRLTTDRSRLGPKSQGCCRPTVLRLHPGRCAFLWCFLMLMTLEGLQTAEAAADARVGFIDHRLNPGARTPDIQDTERAKHGEYRHSARPTSRHPHREIVRKRALHRAINRADRNPHGQTWYRGKLLHRTQLGSGKRCQGQPRQPRPQGQGSRTWAKPGLATPRGTIKHFLERTTGPCSPGAAEIGTTEPHGPMERGGAGPARAGGISGCHQDVDNDDVTTRGPVCDSETRHVVRCVYPDWLPRQCGSVNTSHSSELACHEDGHSGEAGSSHVSHPLPALHQDGPGQIGAYAPDSVIQVDGGQSGPTLGERGRLAGDEVGLREPQTCPGHEPPLDEGDRGGTDTADDPAEVHHSARDLPVPRHEETGTGVPRGHPDNATRGGLANEGGQRGLECSPPDGEVQCMGGSRHLSQARGHATECTRQAPRDAELVKQLRLSNGGNYCYSNAGVKGLLYAMAFQGGTRQFFNGGMLQLFESIMRKSGATHLWRHPFWVAMMSGWRRPSRQHDGAEFLQFMLTKHQQAADQVLLHWQARKPRGDSWICVDHGSSAPLLVHPPENAECRYANVTDSCSVQTLVEHWHKQVSIHAGVLMPRVLVLQVGRFDFNQTHTRAIKRRFRLIPDKLLRFPSFDSELRVVNCQYILRSAIVHHGNTPDSGHYTALLFDRDGTVWHADDNTCSTLVPEGKISGYYSDIYILFYTMM